MKICPFCEAENDDNALNCIQCEYDFSNEQSEEAVNVQNEAENCSENSSAQPQNVIDCIPIVSEDNDVICYTPEKDKKPILIAGITFGLILIIAAFIIIPKIVDKSSSSDLKPGQPASDNNKIAEISEQETTAQEATTEAVTTAVTESTTVTTSQTTETTTVTTTTTPVATAPPVDYKAAYTKTLEEYKQGLYYTSDDEYGIADVTGDGIPELFIIRVNDVGRQADVYVYKNSAYQLVKLNGIILDEYYLKYEPELHLLQSFCNEGGRGRHVISLTSDGTATQIDELVSDYGNAPCYRNDVSISLEEYNEAEKYYDSLGWQSITRYSFSNIQVDNTVQYYRNYNEYSIPDDFYIFTKSLSAKVNVQSGGLNLRAAPSTDSFVITLLPNDTDLWVMASNGSWSLVRYYIYDNGRDMSFFGYVSNEFLAYN